MNLSNWRSTKGITLISLVITIIVLLILASTTIGVAINGGVIGKTKSVSSSYKEAETNEVNKISNLEELMNAKINANTINWNSINNNSSENITTSITVAESINEQKIYSKTTEITDSLGNKIKIPAGFKIASDSGTKVADGIVIEDASAGDTTSVGNQFVWVPVGTGIKKSTTETVSIELGRYTFSKTDGTPTLVQSGSNYGLDVAIDTYYHEIQTSTSGNKTAKSLSDFVTSVSKNGGYYLARYEAGKTTDTNKCVSKNNVVVYNNITQLNSATIAKNMYSANVTSDLVNSYAWDTAIVYIEKCGTNTNYANAAFQTKLVNTGMATIGTKQDVQCKIYDMAGSVQEYTTENSMDQYPCTLRGGRYSDSLYFTDSRGGNGTTRAYDYIGFRPILYLNDEL